jgi:hypothetical protein
MFTGVNKTTQKTQILQEANSAEKDKESCSQTNVF